jgi:hypothetical protein
VLTFRSEAATTGEKDIKQQLDMQQLQEALKQIQTERDVRPPPAVLTTCVTPSDTPIRLGR